jgi:hypothetical protein
VRFEPDPELWPVPVDVRGRDEGMREVAHG